MKYIAIAFSFLVGCGASVEAPTSDHNSQPEADEAPIVNSTPVWRGPTMLDQCDDIMAEVPEWTEAVSNRRGAVMVAEGTVFDGTCTANLNGIDIATIRCLEGVCRR